MNNPDSPGLQVWHGGSTMRFDQELGVALDRRSDHQIAAEKPLGLRERPSSTKAALHG
jgi:hypothetical protein